MSLPHILVVDDSPSLRRMTGACLRAGGFTVTEASDGKEAHEVAMEGQFGMLVTDQVMPVMDGLQFLEARRDQQLAAGVPVVMITTEGSEPFVLRAIAAGAQGYISKPFTAEQVKARVAPLIEAV